MKTKSLVLCAVCAALCCALAPLSVPLVTAVPVSLASFAVMLTATLLEKKQAMISVGVYLLIGALGLPVFAGYRGGIGVLFGPTGGYLIGYLPMAFFVGLFHEKTKTTFSDWKKTLFCLLSLIAGNLILYLFGTAWFCVVTSTPILAALMTCVVPFLIGDAAKIAAVMLLSPSLEKAIKKIPDRADAADPQQRDEKK